MNLELTTKSAPTSGDTVLARDILTNKAVEIPIESLGGNGSGLIGSNPHNTTKSDIGLGNVDNTSDVNKPISLATQNALNLKADKGLNIKITTPSNWVTGTLSEAEVLKVEIPPNSLSENDILTISTIMIDKLGTTGNLNIFGKLSTSPTMPSGATDQIFRYTVTSANQFGEIYKDFIINGGEIKGFPFTVSNASSIGTVNPSLFSSKPIDVTVTNYLYISLQGNASDQFRLLGLKISNQ